MKQFIQVTKKNTLGSNLTELNAMDSATNLFWEHSDWAAHISRYGHVMDAVQRQHAKTILDVGCGKLQLLKYFWRNRSQFDGVFTGLDLRARETWMEEIGWSKGDLNLVQMDVVLDDLPTQVPQQYDVVVCTEVLEHVPRDKAVELISRLYDWTAPGGTCYLSTPNAGVSDSTAENHKDEDGVSREWSYQDKLDMVKYAGFEVLNSFGTFIALRNIPWDFMSNPQIQIIRKMLPYAFFTVFAAAPFPDRANNCLMELKK